MTENCETLKETEEIFQYGIHRFQEEILDCEEDELLIHISKTLATPAPYTFLYETLKPFGFNKVQIRDILNTHTAIPAKQFIAGLIPGKRQNILAALRQHKCSRTNRFNSNNRYLYDRKTKSRIYALPPYRRVCDSTATRYRLSGCRQTPISPAYP